MDGERRSYDCGGMMLPHQAVQEGPAVLILRKQNGEMAPNEHVATLPLANIREYKVADKHA